MDNMLYWGFNLRAWILYCDDDDTKRYEEFIGLGNIWYETEINCQNWRLFLQNLATFSQNLPKLDEFGKKLQI